MEQFAVPKYSALKVMMFDIELLHLLGDLVMEDVSSIGWVVVSHSVSIMSM